MLLRDLMCEGRPAFPPKWQDPNTGAEPLRNEPLAGILVEVEWGRHNLSLELTNFWRGRRLSGRFLTDDATILPRVHAMLSASVPRHLDELIDLEIPPAAPPRVVPSPQASVAASTETGPAEPSSPEREQAPGLHPDVALLVATLVRKGLLDPADVEDTRREIAAAAAPVPASAPAAVSSPWAASPLAIRLREALALNPNESLDPAALRMTPRK
jgi:hypothetical protein